MCHVASMTVMYIGLAIIQLNFQFSDEQCVGLGIIEKSRSKKIIY